MHNFFFYVSVILSSQRTCDGLIPHQRIVINMRIMNLENREHWVLLNSSVIWRERN